MKSLFIAILFLSSIVASNAEEFTLKPGIGVDVAIKALDKFGYSHRNQHGLQWAAPDGEDFVFCKLASNQTLVLVCSTKTEKIERLIVVADQKRGKEYPVITPDAVKITKESFALVFTKKAEQNAVE